MLDKYVSLIIIFEIRCCVDAICTTHDEFVFISVVMVMTSFFSCKRSYFVSKGHDTVMSRRKQQRAIVNVIFPVLICFNILVVSTVFLAHCLELTCSMLSISLGINYSYLDEVQMIQYMQ